MASLLTCEHALSRSSALTRGTSASALSFCLKRPTWRHLHHTTQDTFLTSSKVIAQSLGRYGDQHSPQEAFSNAASSGTWLERSGLVAGLLPPMLWGTCWGMSMGLMHAGYTTLWFMGWLGHRLFSGVLPQADFVDLALKTAQQWSAGNSQAGGDVSSSMQLLLVAAYNVWNSVQQSMSFLIPVIPGLMALAQLSALLSGLVFATTLTPLRPLIASMYVKWTQGRWPTHMSSRPPADKKSLQSANYASRMFALEQHMREIGRLSLVVLLTTAQAADVTAPSLVGTTLPTGGSFNPASTLFVLTAPVNDLLLPLMVSFASLSLLAQGIQDSNAAAGMQGGACSRSQLGFLTCLTRLLLDVGLIVVALLGYGTGKVSGTSDFRHAASAKASAM